MGGEHVVQYLVLIALGPAAALGWLWEWLWQKHTARVEYQATCPHYPEDVTPDWADQSKRSYRCTDPQCGKQWFEKARD